MLSVAYKSDAAWNESFWKNAEFDKILIAARAELDEGKRKTMYHDLQTLVVDDGGEIIPMFNNFLFGSQDSINGFVEAPVLTGLRVAEQVWLA
jgi:peptide/nickel transport system substrate-binding protein